MPTEQKDIAFPDFRSILDLPTTFGRAPGPAAEDRFTGSIDLPNGEKIEASAGEALFNGQFFKVGQALANGRRQVLDAKTRVVGSIFTDEEGNNKFEQSTAGNVAEMLYGNTRATVQNAQQNPNSNSSISSTRANPNPGVGEGITNTRANLMPNYTKIMSSIDSKDGFDPALLVGGTPQAAKDEMKQAAIRKIMSFFKS